MKEAREASSRELLREEGEGGEAIGYYILNHEEGDEVGVLIFWLDTGVWKARDADQVKVRMCVCVVEGSARLNSRNEISIDKIVDC